MTLWFAVAQIVYNLMFYGCVMDSLFAIQAFLAYSACLLENLMAKALTNSLKLYCVNAIVECSIRVTLEL